MASPWCGAVLYSPDPPFLFGGGSGNETSSDAVKESTNSFILSIQGLGP